MIKQKMDVIRGFNSYKVLSGIFNDFLSSGITKHLYILGLGLFFLGGVGELLNVLNCNFSDGSFSTSG